MTALEKEDIQGLIARGYGKLPAARFLLIKGIDKTEAKSFLSSIQNKITPASISPEDFALNIAFTSHGLRFLGLPNSALSSFSREFIEGMTDPDRSIFLGDQNANDPNKWSWGGEKNKEIHILLMLYANKDTILEKEYQEINTNPHFIKGFETIAIKETATNIESKEHFGFRDGISRPNIKGLRKPRKGEDNPQTPLEKVLAPVNAGEFVLGYENEYNRLTEIPTVLDQDDPKGLLKDLSYKKGFKGLGANGTYLVYREMKQEVYAFWKYMEANSQEEGKNKTESAIKLGSQMVGRWPSGCPMVESPKHDDPSKALSFKFGYEKEDQKGLKCPMGSHVRRTNPRDHLVDHDHEASIEMIRKHHLLRRGRVFGPPLAASMKPEDVLKLGQDDGQERGLHFICLNTDISRQFEFVQSIWAQSPKFAGLYDEGDPIIGARVTEDETRNDSFTSKTESSPIRNKYKHLPQFTTVTGGSYFFMPGMRALRYIAE